MFLSGDGECGNTPHHSKLSPEDFAVCGDVYAVQEIRVRDEYTTSNPRLPRSEQAECQKINSYRSTARKIRSGTRTARLPILSVVSTEVLLNSSATRSVWPPVAVYCALGGLPSWKLEKRAYGFVALNFAVSVIALSASGGERLCGKLAFTRHFLKSLLTGLHLVGFS